MDYESDTPEKTGIYACRVPQSHGLWEDIFLFWDGNRWCYPGSDQYYRGELFGVWWIGPLPRKISQCPAYIYALKSGEHEGYIDGPTQQLNDLLRSAPRKGEAIYRVDLEEHRKVYTSFNGRWMKVK